MCRRSRDTGEAGPSAATECSGLWNPCNIPSRNACVREIREGVTREIALCIFFFSLFYFIFFFFILLSPIACVFCLWLDQGCAGRLAQDQADCLCLCLWRVEIYCGRELAASWKSSSAAGNGFALARVQNVSWRWWSFFFGARRNQTRPQIVIWQVLQTTRVSQNTTTNAFHALARSTLTPASRQRHASATPAAPMTHFELNLMAACCCDLLCIKSLPPSPQRKLTKLLHHEGPHAPCSDVHA